MRGDNLRADGQPKHQHKAEEVAVEGMRSCGKELREDAAAGCNVEEGGRNVAQQGWAQTTKETVHDAEFSSRRHIGNGGDRRPLN
jgi:hypothetical protein